MTPASQTWWQQCYRIEVSELSEGGVFKNMTQYRNIASKTPRHSH
jgi:hypothetical protein